MSVRRDRPFAEQVRANSAMARVLDLAARAALVLGAVGVLLPGPAGLAAAWAAVGVVVTVPLARVGWLGVRWIDRRDWRFASLAVGLLLIVATAGGLALLQR